MVKCGKIPAMPDQATHPSRTQRRRDQTRAALLAAGRRLFSERGIGEVTIQQITDSADVAKGSFYMSILAKRSSARPPPRRSKKLVRPTTAMSSSRKAMRPGSLPRPSLRHFVHAYMIRCSADSCWSSSCSCPTVSARCGRISDRHR